MNEQALEQKVHRIGLLVLRLLAVGMVVASLAWLVVLGARHDWGAWGTLQAVAIRLALIATAWLALRLLVADPLARAFGFVMAVGIIALVVVVAVPFVVMPDFHLIGWPQDSVVGLPHQAPCGFFGCAR